MLRAYSKIFAVTNDEDVRKTILKVNTERDARIEILDEDELDILPSDADCVLIEERLAPEVKPTASRVVVLAKSNDAVLSLMESGYKHFIFSRRSEMQLLSHVLMYVSDEEEHVEVITVGKIRIDFTSGRAWIGDSEIKVTSAMLDYIDRVYVRKQAESTTDRVMKCRLRKRYGNDVL